MVGGSTIGADAVVALSRAIDAATDRGELEEAIRLASLQGAELTREQAIAETLQRSLLPDALPQVPALDLAVRYLPATDGATDGADWYDAFPYRPRCWAVSGRLGWGPPTPPRT